MDQYFPLNNSSKLYIFLPLLAKVQVAQSIDKRVAAFGYVRVPSDMIEQVLEMALVAMILSLEAVLRISPALLHALFHAF